MYKENTIISDKGILWLLSMLLDRNIDNGHLQRLKDFGYDYNKLKKQIPKAEIAFYLTDYQIEIRVPYDVYVIFKKATNSYKVSEVGLVSDRCFDGARKHGMVPER